MNRQTCLYSGRVQGVGFRYTVQNLALQYNVCGYVRNLSDGRVELVVEGPEADMGGLREAIRQRMSDYISDETCQISPATGEFRQFYVKH